MKKSFLILLTVIMMFTLVACGDTPPEKENGKTDNTPKEVANKDGDESNADIYFKDGEVKIEDLKINIKETKVIQVGEKGNEYGEKPVFAIWYDVTNLTDEEIDPSTAWIAVFTAVQDNDPNAVNELEVGSLPDEKHLDSQLQIIKKDGTVENSIAYELDDLETPVILIANQGIMGDEIGREEYKIK